MIHPRAALAGEDGLGVLEGVWLGEGLGVRRGVGGHGAQVNRAAILEHGQCRSVVTMEAGNRRRQFHRPIGFVRLETRRIANVGPAPFHPHPLPESAPFRKQIARQIPMTSNPSERDGRTWPLDHPEAFAAGRRDVILSWMRAKRAAKGNRPVLWSEAMYEMGLSQHDADWQGLINDGVIEAVFPEAKRGDSGRQFWDFAHFAATAEAA